MVTQLPVWGRHLLDVRRHHVEAVRRQRVGDHLADSCRATAFR
jgi:hypothetical protein